MISQTVPVSKINFLGINIHDVTMREALELIDEAVRRKRPGLRMFSVNVACFVESLDSTFIRSFYERCELLTLDGMGIFYAGKLFGLPFRETVPTAYVTFELLKIAAIKQYRIYILGSKASHLVQAIKNIRQNYPGVNVVGSHHGYFTAQEEPIVVEQIAKTNPDILLIGISTPTKEQFVAKNFE